MAKAATKIALTRACGQRSSGELVAANFPELTIVTSGEEVDGLVPGVRLGLSIDAPEAGGGDGSGLGPAEADRLEDEIGVEVVNVGPAGGSLRVMTLLVVSRRDVARLSVGQLRSMLNEREVFRTPVDPQTIDDVRCRITDTNGRPVGPSYGSWLLDASYEGLGILVDRETDQKIQRSPFVSVTFFSGDVPIMVTGSVRHRSRVVRGMRLGIHAGDGASHWGPSEDAQMRQFVVHQQRLTLARRRRTA